jgi:hypothetical protein
MEISANYVAMCKGVHGLPLRLFSAHLVKKGDRVHVPKCNSDGEAWGVLEYKWGEVYFKGISRAIKASKGEYFWLPTVDDLKAMCEEQRLRIKSIEDPRNVIGWEHAARFATPEEGWLAYLMKCGTANKRWKDGEWMR